MVSSTETLAVAIIFGVPVLIALCTRFMLGRALTLSLWLRLVIAAYVFSFKVVVMAADSIPGRISWPAYSAV